jgi:hypothetical protein
MARLTVSGSGLYRCAASSLNLRGSFGFKCLNVKFMSCELKTVKIERNRQRECLFHMLYRGLAGSGGRSVGSAIRRLNSEPRLKNCQVKNGKTVSFS